MIKPYKDTQGTKKEQVEQMFDSIAPKYDFLNHFLSMGIDKLWRRKAIRLLKRHNASNLLDIATGTGDFAIAAMRLNLKEIVGIDISEQMLKVGQQKIAKKGLNGIIQLEKGDSEDLQFETNYFDLAISGFGVRNFENLNKGLSEINRVLKPGGTCCVLEFSKPKAFPVKQLYNFYFKFILPTIGRAVSKDSSAYTYLPESVNAFPEGENFLKELEKAGFSNTSRKPLSFGIASLYFGEKL